jgi:O-antigen/teichoic acid export membrane protein
VTISVNPAPERPSASWRHDAFVAAATFAAGLLGYGFNLVLSHALGPSNFGELSALLAVSIIASVPGTALQAGIARRISAAPQLRDDAALLGQAVIVAAAVGGILVLAAPVLRTGLGVQSWADVFWLAASAVPTTMAFGFLGVLQGRRRFVALGWLLVLVQAARLAAAVFAAETGTGVAGALGATTVLTVVVILGAGFNVGPLTVHARVAFLRQVLARDTAAMLGVLLLSNLDLVLARHYLHSHDAGLYAAGNLVTKAAFWGPSFVSTVTYPRLSRPEERQAALRNGAGVLAAFGVLTTIAAAVGAPLLPVLLGQPYRPISGIAWLFAMQGAALAAVLLGVYAGLAEHDRSLSALVWVVAAVETCAVALLWHDSVRQVLAVALCGSGTLLLAACVQQRALLRSSSEPA